MKQTVIALSLALLLATLTATAQSTRSLGEVTVTAKRPLREIGVVKTTFDSTMLKENIALSMADVLTFNSSVFVKNYGRATMSTVAFRGTAPSHTQVTWNGMKINNPMLGMTDFSIIPSYLIDKASLLHGSSSVGETGGGLGGLVKLGTSADAPEGLHLQYVQGVGSFKTFDEFLRLSYANEHWTSSTRAVLSSSANDYTYTNHDKKENIYDDDHNIVGQYHPRERNRSGAFRDLHLLQEVWYNTLRGDRFGLSAWLINSRRELPLLSTDYGGDVDFSNIQREATLRCILSWSHTRSRWSTDARAGYIHTRMAYDYSRDLGGGGGFQQMTRARSHVNTVYGQGEGSFFTADRRWMFTANIAAYQHLVRSEDKNIILTDGQNAIVGYDKGRMELSGALSAKWQPIDRLGLSLTLREELMGSSHSPLIPALFIDASLTSTGSVTAHASISRNYRLPTLNDLYFLPGGNPALRPEKGFSYDFGVDGHVGKPDLFTLSAGLTWFDSYISDWILWLPTTKGFFSPRNMQRVHSYGLEAKASLGIKPAAQWLLELNGSLSWTPSINAGDPVSTADKSVGQQLPYIPRRSASVNGRLSWRRWSFSYRWAYYSTRYTMSSNESSITGQLPPYFMSNISLGTSVVTKPLNMDIKLAVNNLFNEDYLSVLSRPMPGINFELFVGFTPKW